MRLHIAGLSAAVFLASATQVAAQDHARIMVNVGLQSTTTTFKQTQTIQQYFEQGTLTLERTIPKKIFYDGGVALRLAGGLHAGASVSIFRDSGAGNVTAQVPHPFFFNQLRTTSGEASGLLRRETAAHIQLSWTAPAAGGIEFTAFGGPTLFQTEQVSATRLNLALSKEVFPYDALTFPGLETETLKGMVTGYHAGVDMSWRLTSSKPKRPGDATHGIGIGLLLRYSHGAKDFTPTGGQATRIEVGGLHAGGGLRLIF